MNGKIKTSIVCGVFLLSLALVPTTAMAKKKACEDLKTSDYGDPKTGTTGKECTIPITDIHLTQYAVGKAAVECKIKKVDSKVRKYLDKHDKKYKGQLSSVSASSMVDALNDYLDADNRHIPLVRGRKGDDGNKTFYTTDHHHLGAAVWNYEGFQNLSDKKRKKVKFIATVKDDLKDKASWDSFWDTMIAEFYTWPYDNNGKPLADSRFNSEDGPYPGDFGVVFEEAHNDKYRSISRWVRENCLYLKDGKTQCKDIYDRIGVTPKAVDFMEFVWANYLREKLPWPASETEAHDSIFLSLYSQTPGLMRAPEALEYLKTHNPNPEKYKAEDYGYHRDGLYLYLNFDGDICEEETDMIITP
ncbi:MAG: ParB/Srx family N-terminal domain-containing protein [Magnetococcales bacterium]|nr:ParB/Srx family N-terminal domain-containing protein [Magnetococcales bacterium]